MIQVEDLSYAYADVLALRSVSLEVEAGEHVAVIGANGSGKTTLARCLNGLLLPTEGRVCVDGVDVDQTDRVYDVRRLVGMVFQNPDDQLVATTVEAELAFGMENVGVVREEMVGRVEELLDAFHLTGYRHHPPHQLSGGEKQRLAVAACVALNPRYLVLDEPTSLLDPRARGELAVLLDHLRRETGVATIHITQIPDEAARARRVIVLHRGEVRADGPAPEVFARDADLREMGLTVPFALAVAGRLEGWAPGALDIEGLAAAVAQRAGWSPTEGTERAGGAVTDAGPDVARPVEAAAPQPPPLLEARGLAHVYDQGLPSQRQALADVDLKVRAGRALALLGPSGSGKTTLAQHLNGLLEPTGGVVLCEGRDVWSDGDPGVGLRRRVGLIFQFPELQLFDETVADDVAFGPRNLGWSAAEVERRVEEALALVALPVAEFGPRSPLELSGGERRRAAIAGVLAMDPEVLVLDEPTAGLDPGAAALLTDLLRHLRDGGHALVLISHDLDLVAELADDVATLAEGRLILSGAAREILCRDDLAALSGLEPPAAVRLSRRLTDLGCPRRPSLLTAEDTRQYLAHLFLDRKGYHDSR